MYSQECPPSVPFGLVTRTFPPDASFRSGFWAGVYIRRRRWRNTPMLQRDQYWYGSDPYVTQAGQLDTDGREKVGVSYNFFDVHLKNISYMFR
jgi:hypothetical protein